MTATTATMAAAMFRASWRRLRRDRTALAFTALVPVGVALVLGATYATAASGTARVGVVVEAAGPVGADLAARLEGNPVLEAVRYPDAAALDRAVLRREVEAGVVVPAAAERLLAPAPPAGGPAASGRPAGTGPRAAVRLVGAPGVRAPGGVRAAVEAAAADTSAVAALARAEAPTGPGGLAFQAARARLGTGVDAEPGDGRGEGDQRAGAAGFAVVATLVLFVFTNTAASSADWAALREAGVLARLRATPGPAAGAALGFGAVLASYAALQAALVLVAGRLLFAIPVGGPGPLAVALAATAVAAGGLGLLLATALRASGAGTTVAGPLAFVAGMLGGCVWPLEVAPPALAALGRLTPQSRAVEALRSAVVLDDGLAAVAGPAAALVVLGLLAGGAGVALLARLPAGPAAPGGGRARARLGWARRGRPSPPAGV